MSLSLSLRLLIALFFGSMVAVASAEETTNKKRMNIDEIVVTAQKREELLRDVPISITVESGVKIDKSSFGGVTDVLTQIPGVAAKKGVQGGHTQIGIRGVTAAAASGNGSSTVGYYLDSVPLGFVRSANTPNPPSYDLKRVELLRGPQGTLYGAGGMGGLVRVLTNDANLNEFEVKGRFTVSNTQDGDMNYRGDMAINVPLIEGKLGMRGVIGYSEQGGWIDSPAGDDINESTVESYRLKFNAAPTDTVSIGLSLWHSEQDDDAPGVSDEDRFTLATAEQPIETEFDIISLTATADYDAFSVSSMTSYVDYEVLGLLDLTSLGVPGLGLETGSNNEVFSQEFLFNSAADSDWIWSAGLFYREAKDHATSVFTFPGAIKVHLYDRSESYAVFGEVGRKFADDRFEWTLGLRYFSDDVEHWGNTPSTTVNRPKVSDSFDATTPRLVLKWYPSEGVTTYASYSEGFRSGFQQITAIAEIFPDFPPVEPDTLHNYELGLKGDFLDGKLSLELATFFMDWTDIQLNLTVPYINNATITAPVNGDSASGFGYDIALIARPTDEFELGASYSWNDLTLDEDVIVSGAVVVSEGERLNFSSKYTASAFANYNFPIGDSGFDGRFSISANYTSEQFNRLFPPPIYISEGDSFFNLRASFALNSSDNWSVTLFADNITDDYGRFPGVGRNVEDWYPRSQPRTVGLQIDFLQ